MTLLNQFLGNNCQLHTQVASHMSREGLVINVATNKRFHIDRTNYEARTNELRVIPALKALRSILVSSMARSTNYFIE